MQSDNPIRTRLKELDRSQGWLARRLGVTPSTISRWIKGDLPILPQRQRELAFVLGMRPEDITSETVAA